MTSGEFDSVHSDILRRARDWLRTTNSTLISGWDTQAVPTLDLALESPHLSASDPASRADACSMAEDTLFYLDAKRHSILHPGHREIIPADDSGMYKIWPLLDISMEFEPRELWVVEWRPTEPEPDKLHVRAWLVPDLPEADEVAAQLAARQAAEQPQPQKNWSQLIKKILGL